ncbi:prolipoprotein diacylglyceryl transferase [Paenibacillus glycinis]|uniref:Phosphatidylglycerol--prolipoprotein diacylglyceryl transferase n=1 Tax=Paenibacillus glycinis TaxID=2697035 RepID=A0ABW9Y026_9BACL|nr:prolipoprotein diacylglyceryl transferase [Paenibacillus glycinis]NBD28342.1 prolipoprotein diacylglyceryl transferase [Paenibacillus glycinis]
MFGLRLDPIAFSLGSISVHWYGIILGTAALVGLLLAVQEGKRFGLSPDFFMDLLLFGVPSAIIGARIYFVAFQWDEYKNNLMDVFKIWNGGIAIYGALIGAFACGIIYFRNKGYSFWRIADICAPSLIAGQMIGRWGNFVNQEAYGGEVKESFLRNTLHLPDWIVNQMNVAGVFHHPTFLYESLWNLVGLVILLVIRRRPFLRAGEQLFFYFIWYSLGRFYVEGLRTDSLAFHGADWAASLMNGLWSPMKAIFGEQGYLDPSYGNIRISQLLALLLVIASVAMIIIRRRTGAASEHYNDPIINFKTGLPAGAENKKNSDEPNPKPPIEHNGGNAANGSGDTSIKE